MKTGAQLSGFARTQPACLVGHNPKVVSRFPGAASVGVTRTQFASLLLNPDLEIRIGVLTRDTTKWGQG